MIVVQIVLFIYFIYNIFVVCILHILYSSFVMLTSTIFASINVVFIAQFGFANFKIFRSVFMSVHEGKIPKKIQYNMFCEMPNVKQVQRTSTTSVVT